MGDAYDVLADDHARGCQGREYECTCGHDAAKDAEIERLRDQLTRAIAALDTAPDVNPAKATRAEVAATHAANLRAWTILTERRDPPSRRGTGAGETAVGAITVGGADE